LAIYDWVLDFEDGFLSTFWWPGTAIKEKGKVKREK
jgi:hypothetical protein